ncbi:COX15/CtaA family protein [Chryseolinea lacunae]|uniref:COX15/CtaA family protein n=1 Tax=Chryseolinea lacunae TaxID=2801331 RepID=A0ABS1KJW6_9BACT|nr:COX15/CtaA family protein [Chryseolinea lacunae]MBL0739750.1 COX15/CtaA family protein [Chryseolinea lacunae]
MRSFRRLTLTTLVAVYILILVGGVVRSTGSGMGCPDWPKCFGNWVPPTSVSELPENYKEIYANHRDKKNKRFAKYLNALGMNETAEGLLSDPAVLQERDFNPVKTWIEYLNRIVGVIIGFLIFAVFVVSLRYWNTQRRFTVVAFLSFVLVGFQGWLGSFVVSSNLTPWTITIHMFLALLIVALLVYLVDQSSFRPEINSSLGFWWLLASMAVLLVQILLGTQVREAIDQVATLVARDAWIANLGGEFVIHRSFSWIVLIMHVGLILRLRKTEGAKAFTLALILLILGTILSGMSMAYFAVPAFLQPVHLLLATLTFGMQFLFLLKMNRKEEPALV